MYVPQIPTEDNVALYNQPTSQISTVENIMAYSQATPQIPTEYNAAYGQATPQIPTEDNVAYELLYLNCKSQRKTMWRSCIIIIL